MVNTTDYRRKKLYNAPLGGLEDDSDNNPKLVHVSYDQAKGKDEDGKAGGKLIVEKTDQVMGSCAGAGSGEFHTYRAHRRTEMHRMAAMDEAARKEEATAKLHEAIEKSRKECDERTRKKAEKRKRKKLAKREGAAKQARLEDTGKESSSNGAGSSGNAGDSDAAEEFVYISSADQAAAGGDGGAPAAFKNDGTFLEKMKKELAGGSEATKPSCSGGTSKAVAT